LDKHLPPINLVLTIHTFEDTYVYIEYFHCQFRVRVNVYNSENNCTTQISSQNSRVHTSTHHYGGDNGGKENLCGQKSSIPGKEMLGDLGKEKELDELP
jgi:hypothetical protein